MSMILSRIGAIDVSSISMTFGLQVGVYDAYPVYLVNSSHEHLRHQFCARSQFTDDGRAFNLVENLRERVALIEELEDLVELSLVLEAAEELVAELSARTGFDALLEFVLVLHERLVPRHADRRRLIQLEENLLAARRSR
ncbi:MAG: hypothetical protein U0792_23620 [Gemmataceae bacterium]